MHKYAIAIHGGAGTILKSHITDEMEKEYRKGLAQALEAGENMLQKGGTALDAVEIAVMSLEDHPLFNAGKGAVFTHEGLHEMDAAIMCGKTLRAGAVAGIKNVKNPVKLAKAVLQHSDHVFLCGAGAEEFARLQGIPFEDAAYFFTRQRYEQLLEIRDTGKIQLDHSVNEDPDALKKFGTVGAVALDKQGNIAAATSTGGMTNKKFGRVGDSPVIGAGTYANNNTCAVSCTGHGEFFLCSVAAYDISCLMEYKGLSLQDACNLVVHEKLWKIGGEGGLVALDAAGNIAMVFNSEGMYRGMKKEGEELLVAIYKD